jgi:SnoaL-like domain
MDTAALVDRMVDCFNRHDPEALAACYAPDARVHPAGWPQAVDTGTWLAAGPAILTAFPDLRLHPRNLAADGRVALLEARMTGTNTGPFTLSETERLLLGTQAETLPATGRATDITGVVVLEVAGGRVTAERHYWPLVDGLVQLGLIGPPGKRSASTLLMKPFTRRIHESCSISLDLSSCLPCLIIQTIRQDPSGPTTRPTRAGQGSRPLPPARAGSSPNHRAVSQMLLGGEPREGSGRWPANHAPRGGWPRPPPRR